MEESVFKTCIYCQEKIRADAIKCRFCGEFLQRTFAEPDSSYIDIQGACLESSEPPSPERSFSDNYFLRYWHGEIPLRDSLILSGIVFALIAGFGLLLSPIFNEAANPNFLAILLLYVVMIPVLVWQCTGLWRSAVDYEWEGGRSVFGRLAKAGVMAGALCFLGLAAFGLAPPVKEFAFELLRERRLPPCQVRILAGEVEIELEGGLRKGSARTFGHFLETLPNVKVLHLNSPGGRFDEARAIGQLVGRRGLTVHVRERCLGAAVLVLLSGKERLLDGTAQIGFQSNDLPGVTRGTKSHLDALALEIFRDAEVKKEFAIRVLTLEPGRSWMPSVDEMIEARVITREPFVACNSSGSLQPSSLQTGSQSWLSLPLFKQIKLLEPDIYIDLVDEVFTAMKDGLTKEQTMARIRAVAEPVALQYLPKTSDDGILSMRDYWIDLLMSFQDENPAGCLELLSPGQRVPVEPPLNLPAWLQARSLDAIGTVLAGAGPETQSIEVHSAASDFADVLARLRPAFGEDVQFLSTAEKQASVKPEQVCAVLYAFYRETLAFPVYRQANLLRYLVSRAPESSSQ